MTERSDQRLIGITSTIPLEIVFAAGLTPLDLNNRFIAHPSRRALVEQAEAAGFPVNSCAWIKGIYACALQSGVGRVIGVRQGDCSNTHVLMEIFEESGIEVIPFDYPLERSPERLRQSLEALASRLGTTLENAEEIRSQMAALRRKLERLDELTWRESKVSGGENHLWLINSSDMKGDWRGYEARLDRFLRDAAARPPRGGRLRLGFTGIPPIVDDIYDVLDSRGAPVVYNEFQRQFAMPGAHRSLVDQYLAYTYPYHTRGRIEDILAETKRRKLDGLVHYIQSFCFRQLQDRMIRSASPVPVLSLEFDRPGRVDARSLTRIEAFVELLEARASGGSVRDCV